MVSLIIPTCNKAPRLELTLLSLTKLIIPNGINLEVIIVNDSSTDNTQKLVRKFWNEYGDKVRFEFNVFKTHKRCGRSGVRNFGVAKSKGDLLIFTDDDLILEERFIIDHFSKHNGESNLLLHGSIFELPFLKFISNPNYFKNKEELHNKRILSKLIDPDDVIGSKEKIKQQTRKSKFERDIAKLVNSSQADNSFKWVCSIGANFSIKKEMFMRVGGFDEEMGHVWGGEDLEFGYRDEKNGVLFKVSSEVECVNYHMSHFRKNVSDNHKKSFYQFYKKHNDISIKLLWDYFNNDYQDLLGWWKKCTTQNKSST